MMKCGVPQCYILDPLLFLIDINDLLYVSIFMSILFADDTNLFCIDPIFLIWFASEMKKSKQSTYW